MGSSSQTVLGYLHSLLSRSRGAAADDRELLRRFAETRDGDAFAALMQRHGSMVLGLARRIVGDGQLAEDVFQATFLMLSRKAHTIRRAESLSCWLHGVAFRLALRVRRSHKRRQERETHVRPTPPSTPLDELTAQEFVSILDEELHQMPENQRAPLILCCLEGLSQEEAARRLGCSAGAVRGRLERGRQRLRVRLEKRGLTLPAVLGGTLLIAGSTRAVPGALMYATLRAAKTGAGAMPVAAALMKGAMRTMFLHKLKMAGAAVVLLGATGGLGMMALRENEQPAQPPLRAVLPEKPATQEARTDLYGDPLPEGVVMRLGTLQRRAVGARLAVSADGKSIVGVRGRNYVHVWDAATGKLRQTRELPGQGWNSPPALSSDGRLLATNSEPEGNETLAIWDVPTGKRLQNLIFKGARYTYPMAFAPDGKSLAVVGHLQAGAGRNDQVVRVWDLASGKEIFSQNVGNNNQSYLLAFSPDGQRLLASFNNSQGTYCRCWDLGNGRQVWQNKDNIWHYTMVFTPDGKVLTSQQPTRWKPQVVDLATGQTIPMEKTPPINHDTRLTLTPNGRTLLLSTAKGVIVWDLVQGKELRTLQGAGEEVVVLPDGKSIITNNGSLQRWDLATGKPLWTDTFALGHIGAVVSLAFSADGKRLTSAATDGTVRLWDAATGKPLRLWHGHMAQRPITTSAWMAAAVKTVDIAPDGCQVLSADSGEHIKLWDTAAEKEARSLMLPPRQNGEADRQIFHVRISSDGSRAVALFGATAGHTHKLATWDLKTGELLTCHRLESAQPQSSILAPDGRTLLSEGALVDAASGREIARFEGKMSHPRAFSRDGALAASGCSRATQKNGRVTYIADGIRIWETATGKLIAHLKANSSIGLLALQTGNRLLATSNWDGIQLWDMVTGKVIAAHKISERIRSSTAQASYAGCLAFTPNGRRLATGMPNGTILLWDVPLPPARLQRLAAKEVELLWADLADADAAKAWSAIWRLAEAPSDALAFLHDRVKPYPTAAADVTRKWLADLDSDSFERREAAVKRLKALGLQAEPALRAALAAKPSLEQKRRLEELLTALPVVPPPLAPEELRQLRALVVLERIGSPPALRLLEEVAKGPPSARLTRQAQAALDCLR